MDMCARCAMGIKDCAVAAEAKMVIAA